MITMLSHALSIAINTHLESVRSKVLYGCLAAALLLLTISSTFSSVTIGDEVRLVTDFGLALNSLICVIFLVISGSRLLAQELQRRTVFNLLSRPISRISFVVGKFLGLLATTTTISIILALMLWLYVSLLAGTWSADLWYAWIMQLTELVILSALVLFFSSLVVTPALNGLFVFGAFLAGRCTPYILEFSKDPEMPLLTRSLAKGLHGVLPHLNELYVANDIVYGLLPSMSFMAQSIFYAAMYSLAVLALACLLFARRQFL